MTLALAEVPGVDVVQPLRGATPAFWAMLLLCDARDDLLKVLKEKGIGCSKLHQPNHVYSGFASRAVALPGVERFMDRIFGRSRRLVGGADGTATDGRHNIWRAA